jgi:hypothetical protein
MLRSALGAAALGALPRTGFAARPASPRRPRMLLQIILQGGMDTSLTIAPKHPSELDRRIQMQYEESAISQVGNTAIGPLFTPFAPHVPDMAILNGLVVSTVAHKTGRFQVKQLRRLFPAGSPVLAEIIGGHLRGDSPLACAFLGDGQTDFEDYRPAGRSLVMKYDVLDDPGQGLIPQLAGLAHDDLRLPSVKRALDVQLQRCKADACISFDTSRSLLDRLKLVAPPPERREINVVANEGMSVEESWRVFKMKGMSAAIRDMMFLFSNQLAPAVFWTPPLNWDSHENNLPHQTRMNGMFASAFLHLMEELHRHTTADGVSLADQVGIVMSSELGRFPIINIAKGKDHFPEAYAILMGPGIRPGQFGETNGLTMSTPISRQTGRPSSSPKDIIPSLDDLGATVLRWFGIEDTLSLGYTGQQLDFLRT